MANGLPLKEFKKIAAQSIEENMPILEALADQDRRLSELPTRTKAK